MHRENKKNVYFISNHKYCKHFVWLFVSSSWCYTVHELKPVHVDWLEISEAYWFWIERIFVSFNRDKRRLISSSELRIFILHFIIVSVCHHSSKLVDLKSIVNRGDADQNCIHFASKDTKNVNVHARKIINLRSYLVRCVRNS